MSRRQGSLRFQMPETLESRRLMAAGDLDKSFNSTGYNIFTSDSTLGFGSIATQADGKIVLAGSRVVGGDSDLVVTRLNTNGTRDSSFGTQGQVGTDAFPGQNEYVTGAVFLPSGKILVSGTTNQFSNQAGLSYVGRFNANGTLDTSYATAGLFKTSTLSANSMVVQSDGKVLATGLTTVSGRARLSVYRLTDGGTLDSSFGGGDGIADFDLGRDAFGMRAVQLADGKIVVGGTVGGNDADADLVLVRLNSNGTLDTTFGAGGKTIVNGSARDYFGNIVLQPDGKFVMSAQVNRWDSNVEGMLLRFSANGALDTSFGTGGRQLMNAMGTSSSGTGSTGFTLMRQSDGKFVSAGYVWTNANSSVISSQNPYLARFNSNGSLDATFSGDGILPPSIVPGGAVFSQTFQQADGKLLATGFVNNGGTVYPFVARLQSTATVTHSIGGAVYRDDNRNGKRDTSEPAVINTLVWADLDKDGVVDSNEPATFTDVFGEYSLSNLAGGAYRVRVQAPAGLSVLTPSAGYYDVSLGSANATAKDFGLAAPVAGPGTITGRTFHDVDGDGVLDSGELALANVVVFLDANNNGVKDASEKSATSDSTGKYALSSVAAGTYSLRAVAPSGWVLTNGPLSKSITTGQTVTADLGVARPVSISGTVFNDKNKNGFQDSGEAGTSGKTVWLDLDNDGVLDSNETKVTTSSSGAFNFTGLKPGTWHVRVGSLSGQTTPPGSKYDVTLFSNTAISGLLFGWA